MWGAIIGDLAGSIYEYDQINSITSINVGDKLIKDNSFFSDDSILTIAVLYAIINDFSYEESLKLFGKKYIDYKPSFLPYFDTIFSPGFTKWLNGNYVGKSSGNGAMMRISPVGYLFNTEEEVIYNSKIATIPSHNSEEAIKYSKLVSLIILWSRMGCSKEDIIKNIDDKIDYKPFEKFNLTCSQTIGNCLYALFTSDSFEDSIRKVISFGGDTDTNACIVGSIAEALYGIPNELIEVAKTKIPNEFVKILEKGYKDKKEIKLK